MCLGNKYLTNSKESALIAAGIFDAIAWTLYWVGICAAQWDSSDGNE